MIGCAFERFQVVHRLTAVRLPIQQLLGRQRALPNNTGASCCPIQKSGAEGGVWALRVDPSRGFVVFGGDAGSSPGCALS
jgi:hypothetical protein